MFIIWYCSTNGWIGGPLDLEYYLPGLCPYYPQLSVCGSQEILWDLQRVFTPLKILHQPRHPFPSDRISSLSSPQPASGSPEQRPCHPTPCAYLGFLASYPLGFDSAWGSPLGWPLGCEMNRLAGGLIHDLNSALSHN